jgi:methionine-rich copper-binding protein CopC
VALLLLPFIWASPAQAHATLVTAEPAPNATVASPKMIELQFSTELAKKFSSFKLTDTDGNPVALSAMEGKDAKTIAAMPAAPLAPGLYTVSWTAVSTNDGHKTAGSFSFTVQ